MFRKHFIDFCAKEKVFEPHMILTKSPQCNPIRRLQRLQQQAPTLTMLHIFGERSLATKIINSDIKWIIIITDWYYGFLCHIKFFKLI